MVFHDFSFSSPSCCHVPNFLLLCLFPGVGVLVLVGWVYWQWLMWVGFMLRLKLSSYGGWRGSIFRLVESRQGLSRIVLLGKMSTVQCETKYSHIYTLTVNGTGNYWPIFTTERHYSFVLSWRNGNYASTVIKFFHFLLESACCYVTTMVSLSVTHI